MGDEFEEVYPKGGFPIDVQPIQGYLVESYFQGHIENLDK